MQKHNYLIPNETFVLLADTPSPISAHALYGAWQKK